MHQIHIQQCPNYMRDLVTSTANELRSANGLSYQKPVVHTKFGTITVHDVLHAITSTITVHDVLHAITSTI